MFAPMLVPLLPIWFEIIDDSAFKGYKFTSDGREESSSDFPLF